MTSVAEQPVHTIEVDGRAVVVDAQPKHRPWVRAPGDVLRVLVSAGGILLAVLIFDFATHTFVGLERDASDALQDVPRIVVAIIFGAFIVPISVVPLVVFIWVLVKRRWRLLGVYLVTTIAASIAFDLLSGYIDDRLPTIQHIPAGSPGWFRQEGWDPGWGASFAAALVVSSPWMTRRWQRLAWSLLLAVIPLQLLVGVEVPSGMILGIAGGWFIGSLAVLAFGSPERKPSPRDIVESLAHSGIDLDSLSRANVDARGSTPYFGVGTEGDGYFVKVLGADERNADLMFRVYRWFLLEGVGDERPFSSLRRAVEHEALVAVMAERAGVRTPRLITTVELPDGSMALIYERVDGRSLDRVEADEITQDVLLGIWGYVKILRDNHIAQRDLRIANIFLDADGQPMLIDFGFGEIAANQVLLDQDVAQLIVSTAFDVGAERAVSAAVSVVGVDAVEACAPRMQAVALAGATQSALRHHKPLLDEVLEQVKQQTGLEEIEFAKVERVKLRTVLMVALLFGAVWFLIPQIAELPRIMVEIRGAAWGWAIPALVFSMLTYVGAAMALTSSVPTRLSVLKATLVTLGGSFVNRISPAKVGGIALNIRFLQKQGFTTPVAAASVGLYQSVGLIVHLSLLLVFAIWAGHSIDYSTLLPSGTIIFTVIAVVMTVIGIAIAIPRLRRMFREKVAPQMGMIVANLKDLLQHPVRLIVMVVGSAILTMSYVGALWASIQAFGGGLAIAEIAVVFLAGASIASAAPTPGGIGAVEAALVAGLAGLGLATTVAVPAVFLYRLATFWVPILPGWAGFTILERRGDI